LARLPDECFLRANSLTPLAFIATIALEFDSRKSAISPTQDVLRARLDAGVATGAGLHKRRFGQCPGRARFVQGGGLLESTPQKEPA
jgi:hypothetical protein